MRQEKKSGREAGRGNTKGDRRPVHEYGLHMSESLSLGTHHTEAAKKVEFTERSQPKRSSVLFRPLSGNARDPRQRYNTKSQKQYAAAW